MKNSGDIMELVGPVFGDFGVKLKQALPAEKGSASGIARIIQEMR